MPSSLPLKLTLTLEPISPFPIYIFCQQELLWWSHFFPAQQKYWSLSPQQTTFQLAKRAFPGTNICCIQRYRYKTPIFYNNIFPYCLYPILNPNLPFFTPLPNPPQHNLRIHPKKKSSFTETSFSTANFTDTINLLNNKQAAINSNRGIDNLLTGAVPHLIVHNLTQPPCSRLIQTNTQASYTLPELSLNPCNSASPPSQQKTSLGASIRRNCSKSCKNLVHLLIIFLSFITWSHSNLLLQSS